MRETIITRDPTLVYKLSVTRSTHTKLKEKENKNSKMSSKDNMKELGNLSCRDRPRLKLTIGSRDKPI